MSSSYEATGKLHAVMPTQQVTDTFKKREFVLEMQDGAYTQHIKFQLTQDKVAQLDNYAVGQDVKILFNLRGRPFVKEGNTMYFTNLEAWRIEPAQVGGGASAPEYSQIAPAAPQVQSSDFDDVPF
jgi:single-strand DNA-binding protein